MDEASDSTHPDFWSSRYAAGKTPWDFGGVPGALESFLARSSTPGTVLIPGCGSGYEIQAFHEAGYDVTGIDFSPGAHVRARKVLGLPAERIVCGDFFTYDFKQHRFNLIYERTFLCALSPARRNEYKERVAGLLVPGGSLVGFFWYGQEPDGPPYPLAEEEGDVLFGKDFRLLRNDPVTDSLPIFKDRERWQEWERLAPEF